MGSKKVLEPFKIFDNQAVTGTTPYTSAIVNVKNLDNIGIQINWVGTNAGYFDVYCSIDGENYYTLTFLNALAEAVGSDDGFLLSLNQLPFNFVKLVYNNTTGDGILNAVINGKDIN